MSLNIDKLSKPSRYIYKGNQTVNHVDRKVLMVNENKLIINWHCLGRIRARQLIRNVLSNSVVTSL